MKRGNGTVLVVGAAGGAGLEVVRLLLSRGYDVVGTIRDDAEHKLVASAISTPPPLVTVDLSDADVVAAALAPAVEAIEDNFVGVIICAGFCPYGPLETAPLSQLRRTFEINVVGALAIYQATIPYLRKTKGRILLFSSMMGKLGLPFLGTYVASKFGLEGLADVMRREAARWGVGVIVVEPGGIRTTLLTNQIAAINREIPNLCEEVSALYAEQYREYRGMLEISLEQTNSPEQIALTVVDAFAAPVAKPRYTAGDDAREMLKLVMTSTDEGVDGYVSTLYSSMAQADRAKHQ